MSDIFSGETAPTGGDTNNQSFVDQLVAAKGDTFRDPEAMAKSLLSSQAHIAKIEAENATYRERQVEQDYGEKLLNELRNQPPASGDTAKPEPTTGGASEVTPQNGPEDIKKLVEEAIANREHTRTRETNIAEVDKIMRERFGDQAGSTLRERAKELNVPVEYLGDIAAQSPTAFLSIIGEQPTVQTNQSVQGKVNTASLNQTNGKRGWSYYKDLMRSDERTYRSRQVQDQMDRDFAEYGPDFWKM